METIIDLQNVSKSFRKTKILEDITLQVKESERLGIIGPNGSGKSTLLNLMTGLIKPSSGTIDRHHTIENKGFGYSMDTFGFFPDVNYRQHIKLLYAYKKMGINEQEIALYDKLFQIDETFDKPFNRYSSGMKQKLSIISAFIGNPACIILDEPTNGLDVDAVVALKNHIAEHETTAPLLITSHSLNHLEAVCDRLIFLSNGKLIYEGLTEKIVETYGNLEFAYQQIISSQKLRK